MTKEEAIEVYNGLLNQKIKEAFEFFAPELRDSEDERIRKEIIEFFDYCYDTNLFREEDYDNQYVWRRWLEKQKEQKPAEWSEEDEHRREGVVEWLRDHQKTIDRNSNNQAYESIESLISWLKSLHPSWKPSEQEKGALRTAIYDERHSPKVAAQLRNILNAFDGKESRKDWKPSEEQMSMLRAIVNDPNNVGAESCHLAMQSLYNDLLKLKGGVAPMRDIDE